MLVVAFLQWWYGPGWRDTAGNLRVRMHETYLTFSIPILLRTLAAPWRRITTAPGRTLGDKFRAGVDNLISRVVGLCVRLIALGLGTVILGLYAVLGGLLLILWPVVPLLGPALIVAGLI